jgi:hypothetical protein
MWSLAKCRPRSYCLLGLAAKHKGTYNRLQHHLYSTHTHTHTHTHTQTTHTHTHNTTHDYEGRTYSPSRSRKQLVNPPANKLFKNKLQVAILLLILLSHEGHGKSAVDICLGGRDGAKRAFRVHLLDRRFAR